MRQARAFPIKKSAQEVQRNSPHLKPSLKRPKIGHLQERIPYWAYFQPFSNDFDSSQPIFRVADMSPHGPSPRRHGDEVGNVDWLVN